MLGAGAFDGEPGERVVERGDGDAEAAAGNEKFRAAGPCLIRGCSQRVSRACFEILRAVDENSAGAGEFLIDGRARQFHFLARPSD